MQSDIKKYDVVISSNGWSKITADEVQEHMVMSDYPHTKDSQTNILHIINMKNPMPNDVLESDKVNNVFTWLMSRVCSAYV